MMKQHGGKHRQQADRDAGMVLEGVIRQNNDCLTCPKRTRQLIARYLRSMRGL